MTSASLIGVHGSVRAFCFVLFGLLAQVALAQGFGLLAGRAEANDHVILQLDWIPTGNHQAPFAGISQGFFAAQHIDVEIRRGTGAADSLTKVATGGADYGYTD